MSNSAPKTVRQPKQNSPAYLYKSINKQKQTNTNVGIFTELVHLYLLTVHIIITHSTALIVSFSDAVDSSF